MGESYLQRKFTGGVKKLRMQTSSSSAESAEQLSASGGRRIGSSISASTASLSQQQQQQQQLNLIRQTSGESSLSSSSSMQHMVGSCSASDSLERTNNLSSSTSSSRLKSAARAIFFFRRANQSSSGNSSFNKSRTQRPLLSSSQQQLSSCSSLQPPVQQQGTADSNLTTNSSDSLQQTATQFIVVPKMNALRLPLVCRIRSVEGELMREVFVHRYELAQYLIESLKVSLGLQDAKYFGLKMANSVDEQDDLRNQWLDLNESVCKQIKQLHHQQSHKQHQQQQNYVNQQQQQQQQSCRSIDFYLRIKFYPPNLTRVQDPFLRQYLWLQLRRDLRLGKLTSSMGNLTQLMACVLQYELGDYISDTQHTTKTDPTAAADQQQQHNLQLARVPELNILPNQDLIEEQAVQLWRRVPLKGSKRHQAQMQFLRSAVILETYGFDYYPVRDHQRQRAYLLGFNYAGVKTIRNGRIVHHFRWHSLSKISYERRMIIFHIYPTENSKRKQILGFKCLSNEDCQNLYMRLLEQKYFFTVDLAYFDKSLQRPSCLYNDSAIANNNNNGSTSPGSALDWRQPEEAASPTSELCLDCTIGSNGEEAANEATNLSGSSSCFGCGSQLTESVSSNHCVASTAAAANTSDSLADLWRSAAHLEGSAATSRLRRQQQISRSCVSLEESGVEQTVAGEIVESIAANTTTTAVAVKLLSTKQQQQEKSSSLLLSLLTSSSVVDSSRSSSQLADESTGSQSSTTTSRVVTTDSTEQQQRLIVPALRLCLAILALSLILRLTDSFSATLIELFSLSH